jgi:hypothetical protein
LAFSGKKKLHNILICQGKFSEEDYRSVLGEGKGHSFFDLYDELPPAQDLDELYLGNIHTIKKIEALPP